MAVLDEVRREPCGTTAPLRRARGAGSALVSAALVVSAAVAPGNARAQQPGSRPNAAAVFEGGANGVWHDLTHPFDERTIYWPTEKGFLFEAGTNGPTAKGYYYAANRFASAEHGGTHLDAPRHFSATGQTADMVPLERLVGPAVVVDVSERCATNPVHEVTADELVAWESAQGIQLVDVILLIRTGWSGKWGDRAAYLGTDALGPGAVARLRFPGLAPTAARWLTGHRRVRAVGIDTASIDHGPSTHFESHVLLCGADIPVFENVAGLDRLPATGSFVVALPMKIAGGSGGPLRIVARVPAPAR